ncbi:MAG: hypothetical protein GY708_17090 [Actinomycetia bacterium]|nr:hypothetical protein [Actinomycetes bacterium]MCP4962921.1 hypothetical protein [Actinomycetes bacterium]
MSRELLPSHRLSFVPLVFGLGFVALGVAMLTDTSLEQTEAWLWAAAFVVVGVAGLFAVYDRVRSRDDQEEV